MLSSRGERDAIGFLSSEIKSSASDDIPLMPYTRKKGDLKIEIMALEARNLSKDLLRQNNPTLIVYVGNENLPRAKTTCQKKTSNPVWSELIELDVENYKESKAVSTIKFEVIDKGENESLGEHVLQFRDYNEVWKVSGKWMEVFLPLTSKRKRRDPSCELHIGIRASYVEKRDESATEKTNKKEAFVLDFLKTKLVPDTFDGTKEGETISFKIFPFNQLSNSIDTSRLELYNCHFELIQPNRELIPISLDKNDKDNVLECIVKVTMPGLHFLSLNVDGRYVKNTLIPFSVHQRVDPKKSFIEIPANQTNGNSVLSMRNDKPAFITIFAKDSRDEYMTEGGDEISITASKMDISYSVKDNQDGTYSISLIPKSTALGNYTLQIKMNGVEISNSPLGMLVRSVAKDTFRAETNSLKKCINAGQLYSFDLKLFSTPSNTIRPRYADDELVVTILQTASKTNLTEYVEYLEEQQLYRISFVPEIFSNGSGEQIQMSVSLNGKSVLQQQFSVRQPPCAACCYTSPLQLPKFGQVNQPISFTIISCDWVGNAMQQGELDFLIECLDVHSKELISDAVSIQDSNNGKYNCIFKPSKPSIYSLQISLYNKPICNSPFIFHICDVQQLHWNHSLIFGSGAQRAFVGNCTNTLLVQLRDTKGTNYLVSKMPTLRATIVGQQKEKEVIASNVPLQLLEAEGIYKLDYKIDTAIFKTNSSIQIHLEASNSTPNYSAIKTISVHLSDDCTLLVPSLQHTKVAFPMSSPSKPCPLGNNSQAKFYLQLCNTQGQSILLGKSYPFKIYAQQQNSKEKLEAKVSSTSNGQFCVSWQPYQMGSYDFVMEWGHDPQQQQVIVSGIKVVQPELYPLPLQHSFDLDVLDVYGGKLTNPKLSKLNVQVNPPHSIKYCIKSEKDQTKHTIYFVADPCYHGKEVDDTTIVPTMTLLFNGVSYKQFSISQ